MVGMKQVKMLLPHVRTQDFLGPSPAPIVKSPYRDRLNERRKARAKVDAVAATMTPAQARKAIVGLCALQGVPVPADILNSLEATDGRS
jgi:hypothetical protein